jgi:hypothetical protein
MKYMGNDEVPHDKNGLEIAIALENLNTILDNTVKYIDEIILPKINNFNI